MKRPRSAPSELRTGAFLVCGLFSGVSPYGLLPLRSNQGIWGGRRLGYKLGLRILNGWVSLLKVQTLMAAITLDAKCWLRFDVWPTGKCVPVLRWIVGCSFHLGAVWETAGRNFALLWVAFSATCPKRKVCPKIRVQNGMGFPPSALQKSLPSCCSGGLSFTCNRHVSCSWSDARRRGRSCIPRRWG